jgi:hypothetical protein
MGDLEYRRTDTHINGMLYEFKYHYRQRGHLDDNLPVTMEYLQSLGGIREQEAQRRGLPPKNPPKK